jgi:hypothetical protein
LGRELAWAVGDGPGRELEPAKASGLPRLPAPLQEGVELPGRGVKLAPEDADFRLRRRRQLLAQGGLQSIAMSLGFHSVRLCDDCPRLRRVRVKTGIPELGIEDVPNLLQLDLVGDPCPGARRRSHRSPPSRP